MPFSWRDTMKNILKCGSPNPGRPKGAACKLVPSRPNSPTRDSSSTSRDAPVRGVFTGTKLV
jgi:hypothetical protein